MFHTRRYSWPSSNIAPGFPASPAQSLPLRVSAFVMSVIAVPAVISLGTFISVLFNACREGFGI